MTRKLHPTEKLRQALEPGVHRLLGELWARETAARDFSDPEGVHQMRVVTRRLRAALDAGDELFTRKRERRLRARLRRLARALGAVRDADVMIAALLDTTADSEDHPGIRRLVDRLERQRDRDRAQLLAILDKMNATGFRETSLALFNARGSDGPPKIRKRDARALVERPRDAFLSLTSGMPPEEDVEGLHRLRIATKRLRYTLQLARPSLPEEAAAGAIDGLRTMQDHLGDIHNADVLMDLIRAELHALVDEEIINARSGIPARAPEQIAARDDLLTLLAQTARDRHARYTEFAAFWNEIGRPDLLRTIANMP